MINLFAHYFMKSCDSMSCEIAFITTLHSEKKSQLFI